MHKLHDQAIDRYHTFIADGTAYVWQIKPNDPTYGEFAITLLKYVSSCARSAIRIDIVFEVYMYGSVKTFLHVLYVTLLNLFARVLACGRAIAQVPGKRISNLFGNGWVLNKGKFDIQWMN